ncbi:O-methyltransferase [Thermobrachium celere]|uniref:tRNA 5-hydroxyuridine methyltransferase n=1 Tax=Thermobrachium celere DSM 8682 TaxID=941824 RepID=R7RPV9_9CLOT|nr:O-methyltransferase [Thermobrachium celere]GFR36395.1 O-methyltransferase [Thermobrachium celere]CDF58242.1 FIG011945: O-methyltransferase family protein [Thermobrachium celere DSM 8682]
MSNIVHDYVEEYIRELIIEKDEFLKVLREYAEQNNVPIVHKEVAQFLKVLIKSNNIKRILEVGTAIGYSAILMAKAVGNDCEIVTIERDEKMYALALENIKRANLQDNIKVIKGDALEVLDTIDGKFDMIFIDGAKGHYSEMLNKISKLLKLNGIVFADNVLFRGMVCSNELLIRRKITIVKRMRKYLKELSESNIYETVILPVGDGVALSTKIKED